MDQSYEMVASANPIHWEVPVIIASVGILLWVFARRLGKPLSASVVVFFVISPFLARMSLGGFPSATSLNEFLIRWLVYGVIFGGITWGFVVLYMDKAQQLKKEQNELNEYGDFDDWGDKTYQINNRFFVKAWEELEKNMADKGIWAKALSASDGDENKAHAIYIRLRVKQLATESQYD